MSRLPGGVFVGVVTLMCGLGLAQFEGATKNHATIQELIPIGSTNDLAQESNQAIVPNDAKSRIASEIHKNL
jgi:hypothetical protein